VKYEKANDDLDLRLVSSIMKNAYHYIELFSNAVDKLIPQPRKELK